MRVITSILIVIIINLIPMNNKYKSLHRLNGSIASPPVNKEDIEHLFDVSILKLKEWEGFSSTRYNHRRASNIVDTYIGYGHKLTSSELVSDLDNISEFTATTILIKDLNKSIDYAKRVHPNLTIKQYLAIGLLVFNIGSSNYRNTSVKIAIDNNVDSDFIANKWKELYRIKIDGVYIPNKKLQLRRRFESNLFKNN